jgi:gamma-glutamyltranspeptidase/glutathione hydrolase
MSKDERKIMPISRVCQERGSIRGSIPWVAGIAAGKRAEVIYQVVISQKRPSCIKVGASMRNTRILVALLLASSLSSYPARPEGQASPYPNAAVVSVDPIASNAGVEILKKGGNAIDAAVATAFALAVTWPAAGNLGGGGFMLIHLTNGEAAAIDYREKAPEKATPRMFLNVRGEVDRDKSGVGYLVIGVPGTVKGLWEASRRYGKLDWKTLVEPAVKLAGEGFVIDEVLARSLQSQASAIGSFPEFGRIFRKPDGTYYQAGETLQQPDLARTLKLIHDNGPNGFYRGEVAKKLVDDVQANGGIITLKDLASYEAKVRTPLRGTYRGYEIVGMPPSSSGGTTVIQMLNILEAYDLGSMKRRDASTIHLLAETMRLGFYTRAKYLGDTDFVKVDLPKLMSKSFADMLRGNVNTQHATSSLSLGKDIITRQEGTSTTHFSVVDAEGNAVANTYTLEDLYGSRVIPKGTGFLLNNEMHDFNMNPGITDTRGLIGTNPNLIQPGKRMLSSMSPTIVLKDNKPVLVTGSPGGRTIINTVLQVIVNVIDFKMDVQAAVDEPRIHHQWLPDVIALERPLEPITPYLNAMGNRTRLVSTQGDSHSILIKEGKKYAGVDHRTRGGAAGY